MAGDTTAISPAELLEYSTAITIIVAVRRSVSMMALGDDEVGEEDNPASDSS